MTTLQTLLEAVEDYGARFNQMPIVHQLVSVVDWRENETGAFPGCYAFFDGAGELLWIGKASFGATVQNPRENTPERHRLAVGAYNRLLAAYRVSGGLSGILA